MLIPMTKEGFIVMGVSIVILSIIYIILNKK